MSNLLRLAGMLAMLLIVVLAAALLQPEWACDLGLEPWIQIVQRTIQDYQLISCNFEVSPEGRALTRRSEKKHRITAELLAHRLTLFEAAA